MPISSLARGVRGRRRGHRVRSVGDRRAREQGVAGVQDLGAHRRRERALWHQGGRLSSARRRVGEAEINASGGTERVVGR